MSCSDTLVTLRPSDFRCPCKDNIETVQTSIEHVFRIFLETLLPSVSEVVDISKVESVFPISVFRCCMSA